MPKELLEIKNFTLGTQTTPSETDISHEAASYSLNVDPIAQDGKLQAIPDDISKDDDWANATGNQAEMMRVIEVDGVKHIITYVSDGRIRYSNTLTTASNANALADVTGGAATLTANLQNGDNIDMEVNNQEVHIGLGTSNNAQWVGKIAHSQFGSPYETTHGIYRTDANLESSTLFNSCYKLVWATNDSGSTRYLYGIEWQGTKVFVFKESVAGETYTFEGTLNTRFNKTQGIAWRYGADDSASLDQNAKLWIYDAGIGTYGTLYAFNPWNDSVQKTFPLSNEDDYSNIDTGISDIIEIEVTPGDAGIFFIKGGLNQESILTTQTGDDGITEYTQEGIDFLWYSEGASYHASTEKTSTTIGLANKTPRLVHTHTGTNSLTDDNPGEFIGLPFMKGASSGSRWTRTENTNEATYEKYFPGGLIECAGGQAVTGLTPSNSFGAGADGNKVLSAFDVDSDSYSDDASNVYQYASLYRAVLTRYPWTDRHADDSDEYNIGGVGETAAMIGDNYTNIAIDTDSKFVFVSQRDFPGRTTVPATVESTISCLQYSEGTVSSGAVSTAPAITRSVNNGSDSYTFLTKQADDDAYTEIKVDSDTKVLFACHATGLEMHAYTTANKFASSSATDSKTTTELFSSTHSTAIVKHVLLDTNLKVGCAISAKWATASDRPSSSSGLISWFTYTNSGISLISGKSGADSNTQSDHRWPIAFDINETNQTIAGIFWAKKNSNQTTGYHVCMWKYDVGGSTSQSSAKFIHTHTSSYIYYDIKYDHVGSVIWLSGRYRTGKVDVAGGGTAEAAITHASGGHLFHWPNYVTTDKNNESGAENDIVDDIGLTTSRELFSKQGGQWIYTINLNEDGYQLGEENQSFSFGPTNEEKYGQVFLNFSPDGKHACSTGSVDSRGIHWKELNLANSQIDGKQPITRAIWQFMDTWGSGNNSWKDVGVHAGRVVWDQNLKVVFLQDVENNKINMVPYATEDDYKITIPRAPLMRIDADDYDKALFPIKFNHPLGGFMTTESGYRNLSMSTARPFKWAFLQIDQTFSSRGSMNTNTNLLTGAATVGRIWLPGFNDDEATAYNADIVGVGNFVDSDLNTLTSSNSFPYFTWKNASDSTKTNLTTIQDASQDGFNSASSDGYTSSGTETTLLFNEEHSVNTNADANALNVAEAIVAIRISDSNDATFDNDTNIYGFGMSSQSGTLKTFAFEHSDDDTNPADGSTGYDPLDETISVGPAATVYIDNIEVLNTGGTLSGNTKYFYKTSLIYDGYQEGPLGDDSSINTLYASDQYNTDGSLISTASALAATDANVSITFDVNILDPSNLNKRISGLRIYRSSSTNINSETPEGMYRLVKELSLNDPWLLSSIGASGSKPSYGNGRVMQVVDTGEAFQTFQANTGISEVIDNYNVRYKCSTQLNNTHFVGNCSTPLDSSLLGSNYIVKSKPYNFDQFDVLTDVLQVSGTVVAMASFAGRIFAFSETKVFKIEPNNLFIEDTWEGMGTFNQKSVFVSDYGMCWCDKNNIYLWDGRQVKTIGDTILKGDSTNSWQEGSLIYTPATNSDASMEPQVFWDPERKAFLIMFTSDLGSSNFHRKIWAYSVTKNRWDLWDVGNNVQLQSFVHGPSGEVFYVKNGNTNLFWLNGHATDRKPLSWHSKKLTMGMDTQIKLFKKVRLTGTEASGNPMDADVAGLTVETGGGSLSGGEITYSDDGEQALYSLSGSKAKSEWLKFKLDANTEDALTIDAIGVVYRRRPIR